MATNRLQSTEFLDCPRCGYDLRGNVALWEEHGECPLVGKCSECGLDFEWQRVFREAEHPWLFEYHWRRKPIRSFVQTLWRSALPWKFWREVDLFWAVRVWPLLAMAVICQLGGFLAAYSFLVIQNAGGITQLMQSLLLDGTNVELYLGWNLKYLIYSDIAVWLATCGMLVWALSFFFAFCLLPTSLQRAKVRWVHLLRIGGYSILVALPVVYMTSVLVVWYWWHPFGIARITEGVAKFLGAGVVWLLRDLLRIPGISSGDGEMLVYPILPGVFLVPYWWFACTRYLKIETPVRVMVAMTLIATLMVLAYGMVFWLFWFR